MIKLAINQATTMKADFLTDIEAYAREDFKFVELWLEKVENYLQTHTIEEAVSFVKEKGITVVGACFQGDLMLSKGEKRKKVLESFRKKLEICRAFSCPVLVVPSDFPEEVKVSMYEEAISNLQEAADIAKDYGVSLAVEFIQGANFLGTLDTTLKIVRKAKRENLGVLLDMFHFYAGKSKWEDLEKIEGHEIFLVHLDDMEDVPREIIKDSHRVIPGEGVLPVKKIIDLLQKKGYTGYYSLELFNETLWEMPINECLKKIKRGLEWLK